MPASAGEGAAHAARVGRRGKGFWPSPLCPWVVIFVATVFYAYIGQTLATSENPGRSLAHSIFPFPFPLLDRQHRRDHITPATLQSSRLLRHSARRSTAAPRAAPHPAAAAPHPAAPHPAAAASSMPVASSSAAQALWKGGAAAEWTELRSNESTILQQKGKEGLAARERWLFEELPATIKARTPPHMTKDEMVELFKW